MAHPPSALTGVRRVAMTLDIKPEMRQEYIAAHAQPRAEVVKALRLVGLRNLSLWVWRERMFYYAEFVPIGDETFREAMARYAEMPGVRQWEEDMHRFQSAIPGTDDKAPVWWQECENVYFQA